MADKIDTEQIWKNFRKDLLSFIKKRINNLADAEDILQNVFLKIHKNLENLHQTEALQGWLYRITRNSIIDFYRRNNHTSTSSIDYTYIQDRPNSNSENDKDLAKCLALLLKTIPPKYKEAIYFTEYQKHSQKELAEALKISISGAKSRVQRARKHIKNVLNRCCQLEFDSLGHVINHIPKQKNCKNCG